MTKENKKIIFLLSLLAICGVALFFCLNTLFATAQTPEELAVVMIFIVIIAIL